MQRRQFNFAMTLGLLAATTLGRLSPAGAADGTAAAEPASAGVPFDFDILTARARDLVHRYVVDEGRIQGQLSRGLRASDAIAATDLGAPERPRRAAVVLRVEISDVCLVLGSSF